MSAGNQATDASSKGATDARAIASDVYTADPQAAARRMLDDIDRSKTGSNPDYAAALINGIDEKTLPALSLGYTAEKFRQLAGEDGLLTLGEVQQAQASAKENPLAARLLQQTANWIERTGDVRQADVNAEILKFQAATQDDKQRASAVADVLLGKLGSNQTLLERINQYNGYPDDHAIGPEDIKEYLKSNWTGFMKPADRKNLTWLANNWDHPIVQGALDKDSPGGKYMTENSAARLKGLPETDPRRGKPTPGDADSGRTDDNDNRRRKREGEPDSSRNRRDEDPDKRRSRRESTDPFERAGLPKVDLTDDTRPRNNPDVQQQHDKYWSDGKGNTIAIKGTPEEPNRITIGKIGFTPGTGEVQAKYVAWTKVEGGYALVDGDQILDRVAKVTLNPATGQVVVVRHPES